MTRTIACKGEVFSLETFLPSDSSGEVDFTLSPPSFLSTKGYTSSTKEDKIIYKFFFIGNESCEGNVNFFASFKDKSRNYNICNYNISIVPEKTNWGGIVASLFVIIVIGGLIILIQNVNTSYKNEFLINTKQL